MQRELLLALLCLVGFAAGCKGGGGSNQSTDRNTAGNDPPTVSGTPTTFASVGDPYSYTVAARDPEGRTLTYDIKGKPPWAKFDSATGRLSGVPDARHIGSHENIRITVSDGKTTTALPAFTVDVYRRGTGAATVSWAPPTQNTDGSTLTNLAGYRIYYGRRPSRLDRTIVLNNPHLLSHTIGGLSSVRWFFAMTSVDGYGNESRRTRPVSKKVG
jgi:hypothetical protein